ncbi:hypothetical protein AVEN_44989-1 [Araneus ventricosus]|uniref:Pre-C2HC domain-containing protein n=1 Tax=Araneus ventricosus TaxID=182803 RepID=A0A4Y2W9A7_ARAVE|nr:hypothetical protein AVEN_44989-1 [Araneus ventricosus]
MEEVSTADWQAAVADLNVDVHKMVLSNWAQNILQDDDELQRCYQLRFFDGVMERHKEMIAVFRTMMRHAPTIGAGSGAQLEVEYDRLLAALLSRVSEFRECPLMNCMYHRLNAKKINPKRNRRELEMDNSVDSSAKIKKSGVSVNVDEPSANYENPSVSDNVNGSNSNDKSIFKDNVNAKCNSARNCNDNDFQFPDKRHIAKFNNKFNNDDSASICSENRYQDLPMDKSDNITEIKAKKSPPIMLKRNNNFVLDLKKINDEWGPVDSKLSGLYIKLFTQNDELSRSLTKFLKADQMDYFVIPPRSDRPIKIVIRHLTQDTSPDTIKDALTTEGKFKVDKVVQLVSGLNNPSCYFKKPFQICKKIRIYGLCDPYSTSESIERNLREKLEAPSVLSAVSGKSSANCEFRALCIRCGGDHALRECHVSKKDIPVCINCNKEGHVASYRCCEKFPKSKKNKIRSNYGEFDPKIPYARITNSKINDRAIPNNDKPTRVDIKKTTQLAKVLPENIQSDLDDTLYVINEVKRLFSGTNLKLLAQSLRNENDDVDKLHSVLKYFPSLTNPASS